MRLIIDKHRLFVHEGQGNVIAAGHDPLKKVGQQGAVCVMPRASKSFFMKCGVSLGCWGLTSSLSCVIFLQATRGLLVAFTAGRTFQVVGQALAAVAGPADAGGWVAYHEGVVGHVFVD